MDAFLIEEPNNYGDFSELFFSLALHILDRKALTILHCYLLLIPAAVRLTFAYNFSSLNKRDGILTVVDPTTVAGLVEKGESLPQPQ